MTVDTFAWLGVTVAFAAFAGVLGYYFGAQSNRRFYLDQLRRSVERERAASDELHRITMALSEHSRGSREPISPPEGTGNPHLG